MTVFNVTKATPTGVVNAVKTYLKSSRVQIMYSDWLNQFGVKIKEGEFPPTEKLRIVEKYLMKTLGKVLTTELQKCPTVIIR